jgi:hypothetical protein
MALALARAEEIDVAQIGDPTKDRVSEVEALRQARRRAGEVSR